MKTSLSEPVELRRQGFEALVAALGWVNAVRFLQQYEVSGLDYGRERDQFLPDWDAATLVRKARERLPADEWRNDLPQSFQNRPAVT